MYGDIEYIDDVEEGAEDFAPTAELQSKPQNGTGAPQVTALGFLFAAILYKVVTDSKLPTVGPSFLQLNTANIAGVFVMYVLGKLAFLYLTGTMVKAGVALPGQVEVARVI